ncbi:hypothetical protein TGAM01_v203088 [Trichoderma gamsii]|uniref:Uncharacterized protein n=1 Tax=Trichoderma gamsii TaxID=398673 RepID=A0A2P4ZUI8_9HYPO|nr:hypothetical protein TGAM01_v203088 [Trichoderma gamsii]PON27951.1 hypothetical protein TGAM01_v203088 [Trichoderma gamsii]
MGSILRGSPGGGKSTCSAAGPPTSPTFWARPLLASSGCGLPRWASSRSSPHSCFSMARDCEYGGRSSAYPVVATEVLPGTADPAHRPPLLHAEAPAAAVTLAQQPQPPAASPRAS